MRIEAFLICWNEIEILPFVIKHYQKFCDQITIYDNYSSDGSDKLAESMGCIVKKFGTPGELNDKHYLEVKNNCWKGSKADYVIVCDTDEVLNIQSAGQLLNEWLAHTTIFKTQGWQIVSNHMPKDDLLEITTGWEFNNYSKTILFSPKDLTEINYRPGCHDCNPIGNIKYSDDIIYVLHYRQIGGVGRLIKRYNDYKKRMSPFNRKNGHGIHYLKDAAIIRANWKNEQLKSKPLC